MRRLAGKMIVHHFKSNWLGPVKLEIISASCPSPVSKFRVMCNGNRLGSLIVGCEAIREQDSVHGTRFEYGGHFVPVKPSIGFNKQIQLNAWYYESDVEKIADVKHWINDRTIVNFLDMMCAFIHRRWPAGFSEEENGKLFKQWIDGGNNEK